MKPPCEIITRYILPTLRALIAKRLIEKYGFSQIDAAAKLGMTQSAMSRYLAFERGHKIKMSSEVNELAEDIAKSIAEDYLTTRDIVLKVCQTCVDLRKSGVLCVFHKKYAPSIPKECSICQTE